MADKTNLIIHYTITAAQFINFEWFFHRNKIKFLSYLRKRCNVNPARGPFHFRAPSRMFWKAVRGMVPHKSRRGKIALAKLKVFEGIPPPYDKQKRVCVPTAMKILCLRSDRKYCQVGRVAHEVGWQYRDVVSSLEAKRKIKSRLHYNHKQRLAVSSLLFHYL